MKIGYWLNGALLDAGAKVLAKVEHPELPARKVTKSKKRFWRSCVH